MHINVNLVLNNNNKHFWVRDMRQETYFWGLYDVLKKTFFFILFDATLNYVI